MAWRRGAGARASRIYMFSIEINGKLMDIGSKMMKDEGGQGVRQVFQLRFGLAPELLGLRGAEISAAGLGFAPEHPEARASGDFQACCAAWCEDDLYGKEKIAEKEGDLELKGVLRLV